MASADNPVHKKYSKSLSWLLRHGAVESGIKLSDSGYARVSHIQALPRFRGCSVDLIREIVAQDSKTRFSLKEDEDGLSICANQGHSLPVENLALRPITSLNDAPQAIHGTFQKNLDPIMRDGLQPMTRQHIHFSKHEPTADHNVSGIRRSCGVLIYLDVEKVLADGIPLFESENGVILSPGNSSGCIPSVYFKKVIDRQGKRIAMSDRR